MRRGDAKQRQGSRTRAGRDVRGCGHPAPRPRSDPGDPAIRPDWLCEIVSESNRVVDTVTKLRRYHQAGVPHHWILDQVDRTPEGYLVALRAAADERVRAEPFAAIELRVGVLLGDDPDEAM